MAFKMCAEIMEVLIIFSLVLMSSCDASGVGSSVGDSRGKKKKIGLLVFFADIVLKKLFIFKIIYAIIFGLLLHKAGYFLSWFITYLTKKKEHPVEHYPHHHHHEYGPQDYSSYSSYGPYKRTSQQQKQEYSSSSYVSPYSYYAKT